MANLTDDLIARIKGTLQLDTLANPRKRFSSYGDQSVQNVIPTKHLLSDEGSYFVATNPTISTAIACAVSATFSDTAPVFVFQNTAAAGGPTMFPDYLNLMVTVAPASATNWLYALKLEPASIRTPSGGNAANKGVNTNGSGSAGPTNGVGVLQSFTGGALLTVAAATAQARIVGVGTLRGVIPVVNDVLSLAFGSVDPAGAAGGPTATASRQGATAAPIAIPPGGSLSVYMFGASNAATGISAQFESGWWER